MEHSNNNKKETDYGRRKFFKTGLAATGAALLSTSVSAQLLSGQEQIAPIT